jgi:hypothetical protein
MAAAKISSPQYGQFLVFTFLLCTGGGGAGVGAGGGDGGFGLLSGTACSTTLDLQIGHTTLLSSIFSAQKGHVLVLLGVGWVYHSPQCLHFTAAAKISSPQYGHLFVSMIEHLKGCLFINF